VVCSNRKPKSSYALMSTCVLLLFPRVAVGAVMLAVFKGVSPA
jgi:hypothetical protein